MYFFFECKHVSRECNCKLKKVSSREIKKKFNSWIKKGGKRRFYDAEKAWDYVDEFWDYLGFGPIRDNQNERFVDFTIHLFDKIWEEQETGNTSSKICLAFLMAAFLIFGYGIGKLDGQHGRMPTMQVREKIQEAYLSGIEASGKTEEEQPYDQEKEKALEKAIYLGL